MARLSAPLPAPPRGSPAKPPIEPPAMKKLDEALLATLRRRKADAGILPGVPLN